MFIDTLTEGFGSKHLVEHVLRGRRVLVVEDESTLTMLMEDTLADMGCEVAGTASRLAEAIVKVASLTFDIAVLDINLNGQETFAVADALEAGNIPYVFTTGYGLRGLPPAYRTVPVLQKPYQQADLEKAFRIALGEECNG